MSTIYTIGHSNHTIDHFLELLKMNSITAIADVRSHPYSKFTPHFSKDALKTELDKNNISYVFLGKELGVRSDKSECYLNGKVQYDLLAKQECFTQGIDRLKHGMNKFRIAILCSEKDPLDCHRAILVGRTIFNGGDQVMHIHADGSLESHEQLEKRMLKFLKMPENSMFMSTMILEAYKKRGRQIAYQDNRMTNNNDELDAP